MEILTKDSSWRDENQITDTDKLEEMREDLKRARLGAESSVSLAARTKVAAAVTSVILSNLIYVHIRVVVVCQVLGVLTSDSQGLL